MPDELRDLHDEWTRSARTPSAASVAAVAGSTRSMHVDAVRHDADPDARDSACSSTLATAFDTAMITTPRDRTSIACPALSSQRENPRAARRPAARPCRSSPVAADRHGVRRVRVHHIDRRARITRRSRHAARGSSSLTGRQSMTLRPAARARRQRLTGARGDDRPVAAPRQFGGEPERLSLAAAPTASPCRRAARGCSRRATSVARAGDASAVAARARDRCADA